MHRREWNPDFSSDDAAASFPSFSKYQRMAYDEEDDNDFSPPVNPRGGYSGRARANYQQSPRRGFGGSSRGDFAGSSRGGFSGPSRRAFSGPSRRGISGPSRGGFGGPSRGGFRSHEFESVDPQYDIESNMVEMGYEDAQGDDEYEELLPRAPVARGRGRTPNILKQEQTESYAPVRPGGRYFRGAMMPRGAPMIPSGRGGKRGRGRNPAILQSFYEQMTELDAFEGGPQGFAAYLKSKPKYERGTREWIIHTLGEFLRKMPKKENDIMNFESAMGASKVGVRPQYQVEMLNFYGGDSMFTGALYIANVFLARGVGKNKKDTKNETFRIAYEVLTRKPVEVIVAAHDPGVDMVRIELLKNFGEETTGCLSGECTLQQASLSAELEKVQYNLQSYGELTDNPISAIELHLKRQGIQIKSYFSTEIIKVEKGHYFIGELKLNDVLIATGEGMTKKTAKTATYAKALEYLKEKTPQELARGGGINAHVQPQLKKKITTEMTFENTRLLPDENPENLATQLSVVITKIKGANVPQNFTSYLDSVLVQARLATVILIKKKSQEEDEYSSIPVIGDPVVVNLQQPCIATLHVNCIVIADGEGDNKKAAQEACYKNAWEVLKTTTVNDLLHSFPHNDPMEDTSPTILDIVVKGKGKFGDSNLERLVKMNSDVFSNWRPLTDLIIIESPELVANRKDNAFLILSHSATFSHMLLEWNFDKRLTQSGTSAAGCFIRLQREIIGQAVSASKQVARVEAALEVLRKYYFSQTVMQKMPLTDEDIRYCVTWSQLNEEVATWQPNATELVENMSMVDQSVHYTKEFRESALFQYILHLSRIAEEKLIGSLVLGNDFPDEFKRMLYTIMDRKGWRLESKKTPDGSYMFINKLRDVREIAQLLEEDKTRTVNQYKIVDPTTITDFW